MKRQGWMRGDILSIVNYSHFFGERAYPKESESPMVIRVGIVGYGWWGAELARAVAELPDRFEIAACATPNGQGRKAFSERFGAPAVADMEPLLQDRSIDAVLLATPHSLHSDQIRIAAAAGKHVFCEKPLSLLPGARQNWQLMQPRGTESCWRSAITGASAQEPRNCRNMSKPAPLERYCTWKEIFRARVHSGTRAPSGVRSEARHRPAG